MCKKTTFPCLITWKVWRTVLLGQFLSILHTGSGLTSQLLQSSYNVRMPTAQSFANYVLLCLIFTTWLACKPGERGLVHVLRKRGWKYLMLAGIDVEANFLVVKAYQYTSFTSVQLLDCFTIPVVLLLSWICIKVRYGIAHVVGICFGLVGVGCLVHIDGFDETSTVRDRFLGDMLCISGAALYGVSNVAEEYVVKSYSIVEFLGMLGLFGSIVNGIQLAILEKDEVSSINLEKWEEILLLFGFSACSLLFYITLPLVLQISSSTSVNISILTSDIYSLLIGIYLFRYKFHWLYLLSFLCTIIGVTTYSLQRISSLVDGYSSEDEEDEDGDSCQSLEHISNDQVNASNSSEYHPVNTYLTSMTPSSTMTTTTTIIPSSDTTTATPTVTTITNLQEAVNFAEASTQQASSNHCPSLVNNESVSQNVLVTKVTGTEKSGNVDYSGPFVNLTELQERMTFVSDIQARESSHQHLSVVLTNDSKSCESRRLKSSPKESKKISFTSLLKMRF